MKNHRIKSAWFVQLLGFGFVGLLFGCAASQFDAKTTYDPSVNFASYRTFAQAPPPATVANMPAYSTITGNQIQQRIAFDLEQKGLTPASWDEADLQVSFSLGAQTHQQAYYGAWGWSWYGPGPVPATQYIAGSLVIDIADRAKKELIWHGYGTQDIFSAADASEQTLFKAVDALLAKYPPAAPVATSANTKD